MDAFTDDEVEQLENYLMAQEQDDSVPTVKHSQGNSGSGPSHSGGSGFDPDAWHFDIHGNLISAPQAAYENMEVQQLSMAPMNSGPLSPPSPYYHHPPPPQVMYRPGMHPVPMGRGIDPFMAEFPPQPQHDMFANHMNGSLPSHNTGKPVCHFFAQGRCRNGSKCQFSHVPPSSPPVSNGSADSRKICHFFLQGRCRNGPSCRFSHEAAPAPSSITASASTDGNSE